MKNLSDLELKYLTLLETGDCRNWLDQQSFDILEDMFEYSTSKSMKYNILLHHLEDHKSFFLSKKQYQTSLEFLQKKSEHFAINQFIQSYLEKSSLLLVSDHHFYAEQQSKITSENKFLLLVLYLKLTAYDDLYYTNKIKTDQSTSNHLNNYFLFNLKNINDYIDNFSVTKNNITYLKENIHFIFKQTNFELVYQFFKNFFAIAQQHHIKYLDRLIDFSELRDPIQGFVSITINRDPKNPPPLDEINRIKSIISFLILLEPLAPDNNNLKKIKRYIEEEPHLQPIFSEIKKRLSSEEVRQKIDQQLIVSKNKFKNKI